MTSTAPGGQSLAYDAMMTLADVAGLSLDPESRRFLSDAMDTGPSGRWVTPSVSLISGPPGRDAILDVRLLTGLFLLGERILHVSRRGQVPPAFRRLADLVTGHEELRAQVKRVVRVNGMESVELTSGARARFITLLGAGRGFAADCLIVDDPGADAGMLLPVLAGRPNPQAWYAGAW